LPVGLLPHGQQGATAVALRGARRHRRTAARGYAGRTQEGRLRSMVVHATAKRLLLEVLGWILLGVGILALFLPGPGMLMTLGGLAILSGQYGWARRLMEPVRVKAWRGAAEGVETVPRIALSALVALVMIAVAVLWLWSPPAPGWWPLAERWWL